MQLPGGRCAVQREGMERGWRNAGPAHGLLLGRESTKPLASPFCVGTKAIFTRALESVQDPGEDREI